MDYLQLQRSNTHLQGKERKKKQHETSSQIQSKTITIEHSGVSMNSSSLNHLCKANKTTILYKDMDRNISWIL